MKISVIVSTYNRPDALEKSVQGLFQQTCQADEIIIADDGSGPETQTMVQRLQHDAKLPIHHVWQEDKGFRAAQIRNKAILKSIGEYLVMLDGDCIPDPFFIEDHLRLAEPGVFFQGKRILIDARLTPEFTTADVRHRFSLIKHWITGRISNGHHLLRFPAFPALYSTRLKGIRTCNMGVYRQDMFAVNGFNQAFVGWGREDSELAARLFKFGLRKKEHPFMAVCFHLWHPEYNRDHLPHNDQLLKQTMEQHEYYCHQGLVLSQPHNG